MTPEQKQQRLKQIQARMDSHGFYNGSTYDAYQDIDFLLSLVSQEAQPNLTEHDKTRFLERGFAVVENAGHSLRLIDRNDARHAISIKWDDLSAFRELITLALDDGPMVIGPDSSGQGAQDAATSMRSACVEKVKARRDQRRKDLHSLSNSGGHESEANYERAVLFVLDSVIYDLESVTLQEQEIKQS